MNSEIWLLLDSRSIGGIESHVFQLAKGLRQHNIAVRVVLMKLYGKHPLVKLLSGSDIPCTVASQKDNDLFALCKKYKPAIIHTHGYKSGIVGRCIANYLGIPLVSTHHAGEQPEGRVAFYDWMDRYSSFLSDHIFSVSPQVSSRLPCKSEIIKNFVDAVATNPSKGNQVAFVGRLSHEKGPDILKRIACQQQSFVFHIYGDGPLRDQLVLDSPSNMVYHGLQKEMNSIWPRIGLLLITSRYEGLPMAAIEAMAHGIPVLASRVGALNSLIKHRVNGWLVEPDDTEAFFYFLRQWQQLSNGAKNAMRRAAMATVKQSFSSNAVIPRYIQCYQHLIKSSLALD